MKEYFDTIQDWYEKNKDLISYDTRILFLMELFQQLKLKGFDKKDLSEVAGKILFTLDQDFIDESIHMIYQRTLAEEINYSYRKVCKDIKEVKDEPYEVLQVRQITDGDIYPNNTSEPDIDLRDIEWENIPDDVEFIKRLRISNE